MRTFADLMRGDGGGGSEGGASATTSAPNGHGAAAAAAATPKSAAVGGAAAAAATTAASRSTPLSRLAALPLLATLGTCGVSEQRVGRGWMYSVHERIHQCLRSPVADLG